MSFLGDFFTSTAVGNAAPIPTPKLNILIVGAIVVQRVVGPGKLYIDYADHRGNVGWEYIARKLRLMNSRVPARKTFNFEPAAYFGTHGSL